VPRRGHTLRTAAAEKVKTVAGLVDMMKYWTTMRQAQRSRGMEAEVFRRQYKKQVVDP
jgi:hypothetical protein